MDIMTKLRSQWDRSLAVATALAGVVVLVIGWLGVSGTPYPAEQLPYVISGGIGGLFLLGVSSALWLSADLRDEWRKLDRIERAILQASPEQPVMATAPRLDPAPRPALPVEEEQTNRLPRFAVGGTP